MFEKIWSRHVVAEGPGGHVLLYVEAGFEWREAGCSMCVGTNGETAREGERAASTSNRNFEGRQGKGARTHLVSPAMAAAAAVTGRLTDVRDRKSTRLNSSHGYISYAVFCLKKKK